ncbi:fibronectin type III domain-containing protein [Vallitalea pronyensis]|uniref:Fibronectin type III domain-containing protein n=1 Tax=Vallitalea pronyensis TaxID=1348613 RepID=A0A8J8MG43_9FIRM|nr:fibronectin type III domain-containing protein [Vallitalea pronyensis]QUI20872.1 fibronectin type III domain-containing protein [Vallitalea pronyensis]
MKKRILSLVIAILILLQSSPVLANVQIPVKQFAVDNVHYVIGQDVVTGKPIIRPTMNVSWVDPDSWDTTGDYHAPDYYEVGVTNITLDKNNKQKIKVDDSEKTLNIHDELILSTGSLYELSIRPYHFHTTTIGGVSTQVLAPNTGADPIAYAITDLNVELQPTDDSVTVVWDDIGIDTFEYRIVYAVGDYSTKSKQELLNNKEGEISGLSISSGKIARFYDSTKNRFRNSYEIDQNIYPGQIYSILVEPVTDFYNSKPIVKNINYPYIWTCSTNINLRAYEDGEYVRLEWDIPASFKVGQEQSEYELVEARLMEYVGDQPRNIAIFNKDAATMEYYKVLMPDKAVEYQLELRYEAVSDSSKIPIEPKSNKVLFVPEVLRVKPTKPYVPSLLSKSILNILKTKPISDINDELKRKYLVYGDSYSGNIADILESGQTFNIVESSNSINFVWGAFRRKDVDHTSSTYQQTITDTEVYYDVYVTNALEDLAAAPPLLADQKYDVSTPNNLLKDASDEIVGYKYLIHQYYDADKSQLQSITPDSLYYIKLVAKKKWGNEEAVSEPTIVSVYFGYDGDSFEPPSIVKPPLKVKDQDTTTTEVAVIWKEKWWEAITTLPAKYTGLSSWFHQLWVRNNSGVAEFHTAYVDGAEYFNIYEDETEIARLITYVRGIHANYADFDLVKREIDLGADQFGVSDVKYKFAQIPYKTIQDKINSEKLTNPDYSFVDYYDQLIKDDKSGVTTIPWADIEVTKDVDDISYLYYKQDALLPNTLYLFMVYPYRELLSGDVILAHYPTPIVVATKSEDSVITPDPNVPSIYVNGYTDTTMTVTWKYNTNFQYEIKYSNTEDINSAEVLEWSLPTDPSDPKYPTNGAFYEVTADDLFPNTQYYFWIRSIQPATNGTSPWSNAAIGTTKDVEHPLPPRGIGVASSDAMKRHNYEHSVTEDYIAIEWLLHPDDKPDTSGSTSTIQKSFTYLMEVSDNAFFIDPIYIEIAGGTGDVKPDNVEILEKILVKINQLLPNRFYYVRMKTRITVKGPEESQLIVKDSLSYSEPIRILTKYSSSEYDGHTDPALEILPGDDYELIYDKERKELTYRFRGTGTGQDNTPDNNVDQRLIMNLIKKNTYVYQIDVSSYKGYPITKRKIVIPYSIMKAFDTHQVKLSVLAGDMTLDIPHNALRTEVNQQVSHYGVAPVIHIYINQFDNYNVPALMPENVVVPVGIPQTVGMSIGTKTGYKPIKQTDDYMDIRVNAKNRYALYGKQILTYQKDAKYNKWQDIDGKYSVYSGEVTFSTGSLGVFGLYVSNQGITEATTPEVKSHWSAEARMQVLTHYMVVGMDNYDPDKQVTEQQLLNVMYGIITQQKTIDVSKYMDKNTLRKLTLSGIYLPDSNVSVMTRQEGIHMFVKAYEIINGSVLEYDQENVNPLHDKDIEAAYHESVAKAIALGFVQNPEAIRGKSPMTFGEMYQIWSKIMK